MNPANDNAEAVTKPCPICGRAMLLAFRPFCSKRCADIDLGRWLNGSYAVPAAEIDEEDEQPPEG